MKFFETATVAWGCWGILSALTITLVVFAILFKRKMHMWEEETGEKTKKQFLHVNFAVFLLSMFGAVTGFLIMGLNYVLEKDYSRVLFTTIVWAVWLIILWIYHIALRRSHRNYLEENFIDPVLLFVAEDVEKDDPI